MRRMLVASQELFQRSEGPKPYWNGFKKKWEQGTGDNFDIFPSSVAVIETKKLGGSESCEW